MNKQKGAVSMQTIIGIVVVILIIIGIAYWYSAGGPGASTQTNGGDNTSGGTSGTSAVTTKPTGGKLYTNFLYGYIVEFPADAQNNISHPEKVTFSFKSGTGTPDAILSIAIGTDVTHLAYCLTVPQGGTHVATTTINGAAFLSYLVSGSTNANTGTTFYRALHLDAPYGNTCYEIQKSPQGSATLNSKLNSILGSFTFK